MFEAQSAPYSPICPRCLEPVRLEDAKPTTVALCTKIVMTPS
jgi:hypothetical protein